MPSLDVQRELAHTDLVISDSHQSTAAVVVLPKLNLHSNSQVKKSSADTCDGILIFENAVACLTKELAEVEHSVQDLSSSVTKELAEVEHAVQDLALSQCFGPKLGGSSSSSIIKDASSLQDERSV